nr:hypothetical protein [Tanacetum cinerariifolium]
NTPRQRRKIPDSVTSSNLLRVSLRRLRSDTVTQLLTLPLVNSDSVARNCDAISKHYMHILETISCQAGKENEVNILKSIDEGPFWMGKELKDIWDNVKMLLEGSKLTKEDRESQLYDDFEHFRQNKGKTIYDYYVQFAKLINDMWNITTPPSTKNARGTGATSYRGAQNRVGYANPGQARQIKATTAMTMFMSNLSSADPMYDEAGPSYDSDILSEYVNDNAVSVVQSTISSVPNDAYMMILNDMHEQPAQHVFVITHNNVVDKSLTAELETYKEQVELYERRARFKLTEREQNIVEQLRIIITDRNIKEGNLKKELHSVKMQLASTINHNKSMVEEVTSLKKDFKQKENKYLEEFLDMKALKEKVKDKLYKQDQSLQTVYMLCKLKPYYDEQYKDLAYTMAHMSNPANDALAKQAHAVAPPTRTDDQIFPSSKWVPIGKSNRILNVQKSQRNPIFPIALDEQWFNHHKDILIDALDITPTNDNNPYVALLLSDTVIEYVNTLGYPSALRNVSAMSINALYKPWRAILSMINMKNLTMASSEKKKTTHLLIPSVRFTKLIIHHLKTKHNIHPRTGLPLHYSHEENALNTLRFVGKEGREIFGMPIPDAVLTNEIKRAPYYDEYQEHVAKKKQKLVKETPDEPSSAKRSKGGLVRKIRKPKRPLKLVDEPSAKDVPNELKDQLVRWCTPIPTETSRHAESPSLDEELALTDSETESDNVVPKINTGDQDEGQAGQNPGDHDEGQAGPNPGVQDEGQVGSNPGDVAESQPQSSHVQQEEEPRKTNAEAKVLVPIHQDTSSILPMTTLVIDLTMSQSGSPLSTSTATTSIITTSLPPPPPQQSTADLILVKRIGELEQHMADLLQNNLDLEERLDKHGSWLYKIENLNIPHQVSKAVDEIVIDAVDWVMQAPLRARFSDLLAVDMKEILQQWMFEDKSYEAHEDHKNLCDTLQKSLEHDYSNQLLSDLEKACQKKRKRRDLPRTPSRSPPLQPLPPPPPAGASGALGASGAQSTLEALRSAQQQGSEALSLSKFAASAPQSMAWTTSDTRYESAGVSRTQELSPTDSLIQDDSIPDKHVYFFDDEDSENDQYQKLIREKTDVENNWATALVLAYETPAKNSLLAKTGDMTNFLNWYCRQVNKIKLTQADVEGQAYEVIKAFYKDVIYLYKGSSPTLSISKMKAASYPNFGLELLKFYIDRHDSPACQKEVRSHMRILSVVRIKATQDTDFKNLYPSDFKDPIMLLLQGYLDHLHGFDKQMLSTAVKLWTRNLVIRQRVEDFQLGIESYQT